ncbi:MAG: carbohydrate binding domain-containing protein [Tannerella sp.]|nr:carbohydrate binding domain-containing protein [Tannerella sp.]
MRNFLHTGCLWGFLLLFACKPVLPVTSSITIDLEKLTTPVNRDLYGLTIEEVNHAVEGGLYAEQIRNRGFEEGIVPAGCLYDATGQCLITPAGWKTPFVDPDAVPGWRLLSDRTFWYLNTFHPVNEKNNRSIGVRVDYSGKGGGVVAEGFHGIGLRRGEQYDLSFYLRGGSYATLTVGLKDSTAYRPLSDTCQIRPAPEWTQVRYTFTATEDARNATLVFSADSGLWFYLDMVSLFPAKTWKGRPNGLRADLAEALEALHPKFVRFPGGTFVEGYSIESAPKWEESVGPVELRKPLWSIWGYGSTNGMGFHEYLQLCEDLNARPVYVANAGVLNQRYRLRYEEIRNMDVWTERLENAIAYAHAPVDSAYGRMRAGNGHAEPFGSGAIQIGSENRGVIYSRRYRHLRPAVKEILPGMPVIGTDSAAVKGFYGDWIDTHYTANVGYLISSHNVFDVDHMTIRTPMSFIGEFGASYSPDGGTLRAAVGEAAFLIGAERNPVNVKGVAYSPLLGHVDFPSHGVPAIGFDESGIVKSPSYHVLEMFAGHRGDELLTTNVQTFRRPLVTQGRVSVVCYGDAFEAGAMMLDGKSLPGVLAKDDRTAIRWPKLPAMKHTSNAPPDPDAPDVPETPGLARMRRLMVIGRSTSGLQPLSEDVQRKYMIAGDSMMYNYTFSTRIRRTQDGGKIQLQVRDNGLVEEAGDCISLTVADGRACLYYYAGRVERPLAPPVALSLRENRWYAVRIVCADEHIRCYVDDVLLTEADVPLCPALVTVATREPETNTIILKVVNTTYHEEWASLHIAGGNIERQAEIIRLTGLPDGRNTLANPEVIVPEHTSIRFSIIRPFTYLFPANSVTILRMKTK